MMIRHIKRKTSNHKKNNNVEFTTNYHYDKPEILK